MNSWFDNKKTDWLLWIFIFFLLTAGLLTMSAIAGTTENYFTRQLIWIAASLVIFFLTSRIDLRFLEKGNIVFGFYIFGLVLLVGLFFFGSTINGSTSWYNFGPFSFQPADLVKIFLILVLAKYFSRRHIEIRNPKHIFISAFYAGVPFFLVFLQPDFGSSIILLAIWGGLVMFSGISKKHLLIIVSLGVAVSSILWFFVLEPYQKNRIYAFLDPLADIQGAGYNAYQSMIAVGSGQFYGKGLGFGTQSRLQFLPEHQTDFIYAAFSEEWGFVGSFLALIAFFVILWRLTLLSFSFGNNFQTFFGLGFVTMLGSHFIINVGMNINVMPVTGITLPFMSYGGSHLITTFLGLGILTSFKIHTKGNLLPESSEPAIDFYKKEGRVKWSLWKKN